MDTDYRKMGPSDPAAAAGGGGGAMPARDPFYVVKDKVQVLVKQLTIEFDRWKDLLENTNTANNAEFSKCSGSVKATLKKLKVDLNDLSQTIAIVETNRTRFRDIDDQELAKRKVFVNDMTAIVQDVSRTLTSERTKQKIQADKEAPLREPKKETSGFQREMRREANEFVESKQQEQEMVVAQQDAVLGDMESALVRLGAIAGVVQTELHDQEELIAEVNEGVDEAQSRMSVAQKKIEKLLGTSDKGKLCCMAVLFVTAVILLALLIFG